MKTRKSLLALLHHRPLPQAGVLAVTVAALFVFIDWVTWIELNESIVFSVPLILAAMARSRRLLWILALFLLFTTFAVYAVQIGPGVFSLREPLFINRMLSAVTLLLTAGLLHAWTLALDQLEEQSTALRAKNEQLDHANQELLHLQDEITRQNEELDRRRKEAEEASGRKTRLLASVSHDIRSPVNAINLMAQVIRHTVGDPKLAAEIPGLAKNLEANALSLADLVSDVLDISSFDSGQVEIHISEFSLDALLAEECNRLQPLANAKSLTLAIEPMARPIGVRTDRVKLARIISNLVTNAIKFTQTGGVTLTTGLTSERGVYISVRDTGVGIAAESLDRIFDEYAQLRNPERDRSRGWGLGLAICRRLVEALDGAISAESQVNRGSTFTVRLPSSCLAARPDAGREFAGPGKIEEMVPVHSSRNQRTN